MKNNAINTLIIYDTPNNQPKIFKLLSKYLVWNQNSFFIGHLSFYQQQELISSLKLILLDEDKLFIFISKGNYTIQTFPQTKDINSRIL